MTEKKKRKTVMNENTFSVDSVSKNGEKKENSTKQKYKL